MNGTKQIVEYRVNPDWLCYFFGYCLIYIPCHFSGSSFSTISMQWWGFLWSKFSCMSRFKRCLIRLSIHLFYDFVCLMRWWSCFATDIWTRMLCHVHQIEFQNDKLRTRKERALYNLKFSPNAMWNYCVSR